jgi:Flp pilus assembly pilin Flp
MKDLMLKLYIKAQMLREEHGQDMVEYALVVGIIALASTTIMGTVAGNINLMWTKVSTTIVTATTKIST